MSEASATTRVPAPASSPRQRALRITIAVVVAVLPLVGRVACEADRELALADEAGAAGDEDAQVVHLGRALRWRLPGASHDEAAIDRLLALGEAASDRGDSAAAVAAYREIRSALLGSRALDVPHADVLAEVDARIAALMADDDDTIAVRHAELRVESERSRLGLFAAAASFVAWAWATARLLLVGIDARGRLVPGSGVRLGLVAFGLLALWMVLWRYA